MSTTTQLRYSLPPPDGSKPYIGMMPDPITGKPSQNWLDDFHTAQIKDVDGESTSTTFLKYANHPVRRTSRITALLTSAILRQGYTANNCTSVLQFPPMNVQPQAK
ncbi:hypothetical protein V8B97DRAFT_1477543 [Scleroderma yunnanense]